MSPTAAPAKPKRTDEVSLAEQIGECRRQMDQYAVELQELPGQLRTASYEGDAETVVRLRRRYEELPTYIAGRQMQMAKLSVLDWERRLEAGRIATDEAEAALAEPQRRYDEARDALLEAKGEYAFALSEFKMSEGELRQARHRLDDLIASQDKAHGGHGE